MSIRYKMFGAFSIVIMLACGIAFYGIRGISSTGNLVVRLYDGPLMGISHAKAAHTGMSEARLVMQRSLDGSNSAPAAAKFEKLVGLVFEELGVVRDRVPGESVGAAREKPRARSVTGRMRL